MANPKSGGKPPVVNGFVNLFKPPGITSMDALRQIKRITGQRQKVGHCGTMDPLARGVLPVAFGQATRLMENVVGGKKLYRVKLPSASLPQPTTQKARLLKPEMQMGSPDRQSKIAYVLGLEWFSRHPPCTVPSKSMANDSTN